MTSSFFSPFTPAASSPPPQPSTLLYPGSPGSSALLGGSSSNSSGLSNSSSTTTTLPLATGDEVRASRSRMASKRSSRVFETNELTAPMDEGLQDGPVFRATIEELERGALALRTNLKQIIRSTKDFVEQDKKLSATRTDMFNSLRGLQTIAPAVQYLEKVFSQLNEAHEDFQHVVQTVVIEPLEQMYSTELLTLEGQKKQFDQHNNEYNAQLEKYLSTDRDAKKEKLQKTDQKFLDRRAAYNMKRFDYITGLEQMQFQKEQEILFLVNAFVRKHAAFQNKCVKAIESHKPDLEELDKSEKVSFAEIASFTKERNEMRKVIASASTTTAEKMITMTAQAHRSVNKFSGIRDLVLVDSTAEVSDTKQGFLFTKHSSWREWRKVWVVVDDGMFNESAHWKPDSKMKSGHSIDLRTSMVKEAIKSDRRFCFELISPQSKRVYQAFSQEDMNAWIQVVQKAVMMALNRRLSFQAMPSVTQNDENKVRKELLKDPSNELCADCGAKDPEWGSINLGVLVCIGCSGIHRSLGTHISKMRSITLDTVSWTPELLGLFAHLGNATTNAILEYRHDVMEKPQGSTAREDKAKYIHSKYVQRTMIEPRDESIAPLKLLLRAASRDDVAGALRSIAWGADINGVGDDDDTPLDDDEDSDSDEPGSTTSSSSSSAQPTLHPPASVSSAAAATTAPLQGAISSILQHPAQAGSPGTPNRLIIGIPDVDKWFSPSPTTPMLARPSSQGMSALHLSVRDGYAVMTEFLLLNGADINFPDKRGNTPLHHAVLRGDDAAVSFLLKREAKADMRNADSQRPLDIAIETSNQKIISLLQPQA